MIDKLVDKWRTMFNKPESQSPIPLTSRTPSRNSDIPDRRVRIFNDGSRSQNDKSTSSINTEDLKTILTPRQLTFHFDMDLYIRLNKPSKSLDLLNREPISPRLNIQILKDNLSLINNYKKMVDRVINVNSKTNKNINFSQQELGVFNLTDKVRVVAFVFQKYRGLIERRGIIEHQNFIENELFEAIEYFSAQMLKTRDKYLKHIEISFRRLDGLSDSAALTYIKIKTLRSSLLKLQEMHTLKRKIDLKFKTQQGAQKMLIIMNKLNYKFPKIVKLLEQSFSIQKAGVAYKMLVVSALYCIKKLEGGYYLFFIRKLYQRLEDRLEYLKHKLKQNLYYEVKQGQEGRQIEMDKVDEMIKQFVQIEKTAFHFYKPNAKDHQGLNNMLEKDTEMFSRYIRELDEKMPQLLDSNILRVRMTQLYNHYRSSVH